MMVQAERVSVHHASSPLARAVSCLRPYAQLVRLPNIFTAAADICLGWLGALATGTPGARWPAFVALLAGSACLYSAGMVWNDFFDLEQDRRERPFRPLPSGRIARRSAALLGAALLTVGVLLAGLAGWRPGGYAPAALVLAGLLVAAILLYDAWLKRTWVGPLAMGSCRFLNVLLGLSVADEVGFPWAARIYVALVVAVYIVGVTWFARTEARQSSQSTLTGAGAVMLASLVLALAVPVWLEPTRSSVLFPYLLVGLGFVVGAPVCRAVANPVPARVQAAVKRALLGLIALDATLACAVAGTVGLTLLLLLAPMRYLARRLYTT
jgi:4-hydroxybenzoate polyprenyltransferase